MSPPAVRAAAAVVTVEGLAALVAGVLLPLTAGVPFAVWGFVLLLGVVVTALGVALLAGRRGVRGPVVVTQLLLLGVAYYAAVPSDRPEWGVPAAVVAVAVLACVLSRAGRDWFQG